MLSQYFRRASLLSAAVLPLLMHHPAARAEAATQDAVELQRKVELLESRIHTLEGAAGSTAAVATTVERVLRDAERRSQLLAAGTETAGYDNTFFIQSADGAFSIRPGLLFQFRNVTNYRDDAKNDDRESTENGFELRRMRFVLGGTAFTPDLMYLIFWDTNRNTGGMTLVDAWAHYRLGNGFGIRAGQFLDPLSHETNTGAPRQLAVEDSAANELLCGGLTDRIQGVSLTYGQYQKDNPVSAELTFHDGANSKNTDYRDTVIDPVTEQDTRSDYGVGGRAEFKVFGDWSSYRDFTTLGNSADMLVVGGGFDVTGSTNATTWLGTVDAQLEIGPVGLYGALYVRHASNRNSTSGDTTDWGGVVQAAYALDSHIELFARYSVVCFDTDFVAGEDTVHEITVGGTYYLTTALPHRGKITVDLNILPNGAPGTLTGLDYIGGTGHTEVVLRTQLQLAL